jgi:uncharacterized protein YndB with AHSA1/START domain
VPSFSHSIDVSQPPEEVFPWLLEEDKVPRWSGDLDRYEVIGTLGDGAHILQTLNVAGGLKVDMEVTRYEPPLAAETRFESNGIKVVNTYALEANGAGTKVTQTFEAKAGGITGRMLIPMVQSRLEQKLTQDLEKLREVLGAA